MASAAPPPISSSLWRCRQGRVRCSAERQGLFSRIAPVYDKLNDVLSLGQHLIWKRMSVSWAGAKRRDRVLDLCCGSGDLAFLLSQKVGPDGEVSALDFSKDQLLIATARQDLCWKACYKNIKWIEGDALDLPFADSYFDAITVGYGLRNLLDKQKAMKEIFRVLKPGSRVSMLDFNKSTSSLITQSQVLNCHDTRTGGGTTNHFKEMMQELTRQNSGEITSQGFDLECPSNVGGVQVLHYTPEWMIDNVVVPIASNYGLSKEYRYLKASIAEYLTGKELEKLAKEVGFSDAKHYEIAGGLMGNLVATRQRTSTSV